LKNTSDDNLAAWCQTCHLNMDRAHHIASRRFGRYHRDGQLPIAPFPLLPLKPGIRYRRGTQLTLF
jgi:heterodisulfide reductase subunit B